MLELESIHVPGTDDATFLRALRGWYGADAVATLTATGGDAITFGTRVVHGRVPAGTFRARHRALWVQEPVTRLVAEHAELRRAGTDVGRFEEWVFAPTTRRAMSGWCNGLALDAFDFIGAAEDAPRELVRCAHALDQPAPSLDGRVEPGLGAAATAARRAMPPELLDEIRDAHPECVELHRAATSIAARWWAAHPDREPAAAVAA